MYGNFDPEALRRANLRANDPAALAMEDEMAADRNRRQYKLEADCESQDDNVRFEARYRLMLSCVNWPDEPNKGMTFGEQVATWAKLREEREAMHRWMLDNYPGQVQRYERDYMKFSSRRFSS